MIKKGYALFLAIVFSLFIGGRPVDAVFADTVGYATYFKYITPSTFFFLENPENIVFDNIIHFFATSGLGYELFFIFIAVIYFIGTYIACRKFFSQQYSCSLFGFFNSIFYFFLRSEWN